MIGEIAPQDVDVMKDLIWIDAVRGKDNTGIASVAYGEDDVRLCKVTGTPDQLFDRKSLFDVVKGDISCFIGHNRAKTLGTVHYKNAHPFVFDNIVGAHNGTLTYQSKGKMEDTHKFETDSEALFNDINLFGVEETIKKMEGAWALTWYDRKKRQMNFLRNKERPLWYVMDAIGSTLYWASESAMLYLCLNRNKIDFSGKDVKEVPENTWVRWQVNEKKGFALDKPIHRELKAPPLHVFTTVSPQYVHSMNNNKHYPYMHQSPRHQVMGPHSIVERHFGNAGYGTITTKSDETVIDFNKVREIINKETTVLGGKLVEPAECGHKECGDTGCSTPWTPTLFSGQEEKHKGLMNKWKELDEKGKLTLTRCIRNHKDRPGTYTLQDGTILERNQFERLVMDGCVICGLIPVWTEPLKFLKDRSFVCPVCLLERENRAMVIDLLELMSA